MRGRHGSPLHGTGTRDVATVALDALAVLLLVLSLTPAALIAVGSVLIVRETPNLINVLLNYISLGIKSYVRLSCDVL